MKKCLICKKYIAKDEKEHRIKDAILFIEGVSHLSCMSEVSVGCYDIIKDTKEGVTSGEREKRILRKED